MLRSMTGYGAASGSVSGAGGEFTLEVSLRSVNHKHLQIKSRLGTELSALEGEVDKRVRARLGRGSVSVHVNLERAGGAAPARINSELAHAYVEQLKGLASELGVDTALDLRTLIGMPGVLGSNDVTEDDEGQKALEAALLEILGRALDALVAMRETEGSALESDLRENLEALHGIAGKVAERMPKVVSDHQAGLVARINELLGDAGVSQADLAREIAVLSDKLDVSEELTRLKSHFAQFDDLLGRGAKDDGEPLGRKLDFLCQELFREINTIGSKCNDATVAHLVVDAKTHAERLREQVQNVE
ncbi:MAG: hypothetical protein ACI8QS_000377 [Planctomycetota bacterium]|jgi:uncharacterized protein (TIGR00255 family)